MDQSQTDQLLAWLASCSMDPKAFVLGAFPWGEANTSLERFVGPEEWQLAILQMIRDGLLTIDQAIRLAVASGHGVGKSALVAWIILWAMTTRPDTRGVVTANTEPQLKTKTWAELGKWFHMFIGKEFFSLTATALFAKDPEHERTWRLDMIPWSENNPEAFAGLHNQGKRILVVFDEASAIADIIWETTEGALTDANTQIIWCVFGNPTRNTGRFRECFPGQRFSAVWKTKQVDSRSVSFTNKKQFEEWVNAYGEDSDFVRIRVKGTFPRHGEMEFISSADVEAAIQREPYSGIYDPLIIGVDVARYGSNESVLYFRKGRDAQTIPPRRYRGLDTVELAEKVFEAYQELHADAIFVDGGGVGGGVVDNIRAKHLYCYEIQFGAKPDNILYVTGNEGEKYANKRAEIWAAMRQAIQNGLALPDIPDLKNQLIGPTYTYNLKNQILLEKKEEMMKRGVDSPDIADALALTYSLPIAKHQNAGGDRPQKPLVESEYDPYSNERMVA